MISNFQEFNVTSVPRTRYATTNALANTTSRMSPLRDRFSIKILYRPSISDNITNLRVFDDDQQILHFMANVDTFKDATVDEKEHHRSLQARTYIKTGHLIPKGVASLEIIYELEEHFQGLVNNKAHNSTMMHELINLGTKQDPKFVNISTCCMQQER